MRDGLFMLENLTHRGAVGADPLMATARAFWSRSPDRFFREEMAKQGVTLPRAGEYAVGYLFMPRDEKLIAHFKEVISGSRGRGRADKLGFRDVPVDNSSLSKAPDIAATERTMSRCSSALAGRPRAANEFERRLFTLRKVISNRHMRKPMVAISASISCRCRPPPSSTRACPRLPGGCLLQGPRPTSASSRPSHSVHQRLLDQQLPVLEARPSLSDGCDNGEINTLRGNVNWMAARQASVSSPLFGDDISKLWPIPYEGQSDTAVFDNALESSCAGGYSLRMPS